VYASLADENVRVESNRPRRSGLRALYRLRVHAILAAIMILGLALRIVWMITQVSVISPDGAEYAAMAEHLRHQHALIGTYEGPEIIYGPLYPALIAGVMGGIPNSEVSAQVVSLGPGSRSLGSCSC
jgi:hypothetical protein